MISARSSRRMGTFSAGSKDAFEVKSPSRRQRRRRCRRRRAWRCRCRPSAPGGEPGSPSPSCECERCRARGNARAGRRGRHLLVVVPRRILAQNAESAAAAQVAFGIDVVFLKSEVDEALLRQPLEQCRGLVEALVPGIGKRARAQSIDHAGETFAHRAVVVRDTQHVLEMLGERSLQIGSRAGEHDLGVEERLVSRRLPPAA